MEVPRLWGQRKERRGGKDAMGFLERLVPGRKGCSSEDSGWGSGQGFCKMADSKPGRTNPFFVLGEATVLQLGQSSNTGSNVTLQNSLHLSKPEYTS